MCVSKCCPLPVFIIFVDQDHGKDDEDHQNHGHGRADVPVIELFEFLFDDISDEQNFTASQQVGNDKGGQRRYEYHSDARYNAGKREGESDLPEGLNPAGAQIPGGLYDILINFNQHIIDREHHERQEVVDHAENDGGRCIDDAQRRQMQEAQDTVNDPVFFKQSLPGKVRSKKFIHMGRIKISTIKLV